LPYLNKLECLKRHFNPSVIFADKAGAYQSGVSYRIQTVIVGSQTFLKILNMGGSDRQWETYYDITKITAIKCFIVQAIGPIIFALTLFIVIPMET
jgi:hypothetical protein